MKIALAQLNLIIGDFDGNTAKMCDRIRQAQAQGADLIVFPELSLCAYPPRDFLEFPDFIARCQESLQKIAAACSGITAIVGLPTSNPEVSGKNLFNSAAVVRDGKIIDIVHKALLPTYDIFDEYRYFEPNRKFHCIEVAGTRVALTICEDLWNIDDDPMYTCCPMDELIGEKPSLMINIAASPFDHSHASQRESILRKNVEKYGIPLMYVNHVGAQTELIFDGGSLAMNTDGQLAGDIPYFTEGLILYSFEKNQIRLIGKSNVAAENPDDARIGRIHAALILGLRDYFQKQGFTQAILGLSGGIDSAVVACLAAEALGPQHVKVLLMPSEFSSRGSVDDSLALVGRLGITSEVIPISDVFHTYLKTLAPFFKDLPSGLAEENLQARIRGTLLMAESNKFGHILLNTSNKSEIAVGYGTLYGDMCGGLSVIGDVYKTDVYALARHINRHREVIPEAILTKPPSAELRPDQKDSDSLPEYDILDPLLFHYIELRQSPHQLVAAGFEESLVRRVLKLVNTNEYKRHQTPPILRVSSKAFGSGRRMPIVGRYLS